MKTIFFQGWNKKPSYLAGIIGFFILAFFQIQIGFGQVQEPEWKWQNPLPQGNNLTSMYFVGENTGWIIGEGGSIFKTTDGGANWISQSIYTSNKINTIFFKDSDTGWIAGTNGYIIKTTNGGLTWNILESGLTDNINSVFFTTNQNGFIVTNSGRLRKTTDGGTTWHNSYTHPNGLSFHTVYFYNQNSGWAAGDGFITRTTNGGVSWQLHSNLIFGNNIFFLNQNLGWICSDDRIYKSTDGGINWQVQYIYWGKFSSIFFIDSLNGYSVGTNGEIFKTTNSGSSWTIRNFPQVYSFCSVKFSNLNTGYVIGNSFIFKTNDGGINWIDCTKGNRQVARSVCFPDKQTGFAVGHWGSIKKTTNAGNTWTSQYAGTNAGLTHVLFIDKNFGWIIADDGRIYRTLNGGSNWISINVGQIYLKSLYFINSLKGWGLGWNGAIHYTQDGGESWQQKSPGRNLVLGKAQLIDSLYAFSAIGDSLLKTTDGGNTWKSYHFGLPNNTDNAIHFADSLIGWVVSGSGSIRKTTDGGITWINQNIAANNGLSAIDFYDKFNGLAVGSKIFKTTNGGLNWIEQKSCSNLFFDQVSYYDSLTAWAFGEFGSIISTVTNNFIEPGTLTSLISGVFFEKTDSVCTPSSVVFPNKLVKTSPVVFYGITGRDGKYNLQIPIQDSLFNLLLTPANFSNTSYLGNLTCPPPGQISVTVDIIPDTLTGNNFGFEIAPCHHLDVQLSSNRRRRCYINNTSVSYGNLGSLAAPNAYILVEFPHWVRPKSASRNHVALNDSVWRFNLGTVSAGEFGSFTITDSVLCDNVDILGLSQCTKATAFPAPDCPNPASWSGAEVSVSGKCENGLVKLGIYNRTSANMPDSVLYSVFMDSILVRQAKVKLAAGDSLKLQVTNNGSGVYMNVIQVANHPMDAFVHVSVDGCGSLDSATSVATHFPIAQRPNSKIQCLPIIGAYDPNDKQVFPIGFTNQNIIAPNTRLEYLVRFQNTGNDTAFTVYVIDTLDQNLNVESFEMGAASHPYELSMQTTKSGKTFLRWQFNNILLPDSNTNEPASNGFVQFRISPKPGLALGSKVRNHGEIYFDFNPPIITNQTLSTFDVITFRDSTLNDNVQVVTSADKKLESLGVKLYPNPVTYSQLTVSFAETGSLTLFDAKGRIVFQKENILGTETLPVSLKPGFYFAQIQTPKGRQHVKVVVE